MKTLYSACWLEDHPFGVLFDTVEKVLLPADLTGNPEECALVVWGGADIHPALYNHPQSITTYPGGKRDHIEWALMKEAERKGIPIIGVCRGAQMLCALSGGFLIQDVTDHHGGHNVTTYDGQTLRVNSIHHQMMVPIETEHKLIAWSSRNLSRRYIIKNDQLWTPPEDWREPEFVHFTKTKGFAIQWHPEMMAGDSEANEYVLNYIGENLWSKQPQTM